ncbi:MAG: sensor histidine kinase [Rhodoferax sp.]
MLNALLRFNLRRSVRLRLAVLLMGVVTLLTAIIGAWSYGLAQQRLQNERTQFKADLARQLGAPLASAMWNYDKTAATVLMDTKIGTQITRLTLFDTKGEPWLTRAQDAGADTSGAVEVLRMDLPQVENTPMGALEVRWSDAPLQQAMAQTFRVVVVQVLLLNGFLLAVFWIGVDRLVFRRVKALQHALDHAASRELATDIVSLPIPNQDEFGALTRSINTITSRLREELEAGLESEEEARNALNNLRNAQEGLVRAEKMAALGSLVAGVAHELNTPIGNIVMVASTQQERCAEITKATKEGALTRKGLDRFMEQTGEGANLVFHNATRAAELIQSFKQVAVDQTSDRLREFDLATQISEILAVTSPVLGKRNIVVQRDLQPGITMYTYPGPLGQVLTNLLSNTVFHAFEHQPAGIIQLRCSAHEGTATITVQDNGCGMSAEVVSKIFDPFFTTKLGRGGSGLGLHISHNIVYGPLHGHLKVHSEVGVGTTFTIDLPCRLPQSG